MAGEDSDKHPSGSKDRIIDEREFKMGGGIDLDAFLSGDDLSSAKGPAAEGASPTDATAGELPEPTLEEVEDEAV